MKSKIYSITAAIILILEFLASIFSGRILTYDTEFNVIAKLFVWIITIILSLIFYWMASVLENLENIREAIKNSDFAKILEQIK